MGKKFNRYPFENCNNNIEILGGTLKGYVKQYVW